MNYSLFSHLPLLLVTILSCSSVGNLLVPIISHAQNTGLDTDLLVPVDTEPVDKAKDKNFILHGERDNIYAVPNIYHLAAGNEETGPTWVTVNGIVPLDVVFKQMYGRGTEVTFNGSLQYILYVSPNEKSEFSPYKRVSPMLTGNFAFAWDTTQYADGTYVLGVKYIDGENLSLMRNRLVQVVIDNSPGAVSGEQQIPVVGFYYDDDSEDTNIPDWVTFKGARDPSRIHPYVGLDGKKIISPSVNSSTELVSTEFVAYSSQWFVESLLHTNTFLYEDIPGFAKTRDGHLVSEGFYAQVSATVEGALPIHDDMAFWSGSRGQSTISPYSTFIPIPGEATGWYGIDITGRMFLLTNQGHVTTIAGYDTRYQDHLVPFDRRDKTIPMKVRRDGQAELIGNFDVFFKKSTDLTVDPLNAKIIYVADAGNHRIAKVDFSNISGEIGLSQPNPTVTTFAGIPGGAGHRDGQREQALFDDPYSIDMDSNGIMYVADRLNHAIRKIDRDGNVTTIAGGPAAPPVPYNPTHNIGGDDNIPVRDQLTQNAPFGEATIAYPQVVRVDSRDNVIIAEDWTRAVRRLNFSNHVVELIDFMVDNNWGTWLWMDVDVNGTIGPKDDILVAMAESLGLDRRIPNNRNHSNDEIFRFSQTGAYPPHQAVSKGAWGDISDTFHGYVGNVTEPMSHYPWGVAIDDSEARFIATGFGSSGIYSLRPLRSQDPTGYDDRRYKEGKSIYISGSVWNFPFNIRPGFSMVHGARGFNTFGGSVLNFDDMALLPDNVRPINPDGSPDLRAFTNNVDIARFLRNGTDGMIQRPELTGKDLVSLIYFVRHTSLEGELREISIPEIERELESASLHNRADTEGPGISNVRVQDLGKGKVQLTWVTNEPALGLVAYGPTVEYGLTSDLEVEYQTQHRMVISDLIPDGVNGGFYRLSIYAKDIAGNVVRTSDFGFGINPFEYNPGGGDSTPPASPSGLKVAGMGNKSLFNNTKTYLDNG